MTHTLNRTQYLRTLRDFREIAKSEAGRLEFFSSAFWFFGTELETLRLLKHYRGDAGAAADYSPNRATHYFKLETPSLVGEIRA